MIDCYTVLAPAADRLVPNVSSEVHFIVQMLTATIPPTAAHKLTHGQKVFLTIGINLTEGV